MRRRSAIAFLLFVFLPSSVSANMASPARAGQLNIEPNGIKKIAITRETLTINLRSLPENQQAIVEAIYQINNLADAQKIELVFIAAAQNVANFQIWLDEQLIPSQAIERTNFPATWQAPRFTPGFQTGQEILYTAFPAALTKPLQFSLTVSSGAHTIKVRYQSALSFNVSGSPTKYWQFAYILAPAREWASFGGLDITVNLPAGYKHVASLPLQQNGETLRGNFNNLPTDAMALTLQYLPSRTYLFINTASLWIFMAALLLGFSGCIWLGWTQAQSIKWLPILAASFGWSILIGLTGWLAIFGADYFLPKSEIARYGYGAFFQVLGLFLLIVVAFGIGIIAAFLTAKITRRNAA